MMIQLDGDNGSLVIVTSSNSEKSSLLPSIPDEDKDSIIKFTGKIKSQFISNLKQSKFEKDKVRLNKEIERIHKIQKSPRPP